MKKFLTTVSWDTMECQESEKLVATILKKKKKRTTIIYKKIIITPSRTSQ